MRKRWGRIAGFGGWVVMLAAIAVGSAEGQDRPAAKIHEDIDGVVMPQIATGDRNNREAVRAYITQRQAAMERKAALIAELAGKYPDDPSLAQLVPERWQALLSIPRTADEAKREIDATILRGDNEKLTNEAMFFKVLLAFKQAGPKPKFADLMPAVESYIRRFPADPRGAEMLMAMSKITDDKATQAILARRIETSYPASPLVKISAAERRRSEGVGKPFPLDFADAIKGGPVNSASLKGKVVVVDFWATWCGPCVAEMPKMKDLYAKYQDKGVEFIGVSLDAPRDEGGFDKLKEFVAANQIAWPQYYEGTPPARDFASSWGIEAIPTVFAVDADGNLATTDARGKLDELIPQLLARAGRPVEAPKDAEKTDKDSEKKGR